MTQIPRSIKLEPENWEAVKALAKASGQTVNAYIVSTLRQHAIISGKRWKESGSWGGKRQKRIINE